jgi:hypothetical protein
MTPTPPASWTWPTHPDGTPMTIRENMTIGESRETIHKRMIDRQIARYVNTLRYLEDEK